MNFSTTEINNISRLEHLSSSRQARFFIAPLLGFILASIFPNLAIARLQQGSIKFQYDPLPLVPPQPPPSISIYQTNTPTWEPVQPVTKPPEEFQLEPTGGAHPIHEDAVHFQEIVSTNIESPSEYLVPPQAKSNSKVSVKRAISPRYLAAFIRSNRYTTRRRRPHDYFEYDAYDYLTTPRFRNRRRNNAKRPSGFDYDYDYDYNDYGRPSKRKSPPRRRTKTKNRKGQDYDSEEEFNDDVEPVTTAVVRPRQQQTTTTTTESTTTLTTTTANSTASNSTTTHGYGYGPYTGNENISITYGPPSAIKPIYGVPGSAYGTPLGEWTPSYPYESSNSYSNPQTSYYNPTSYASPGSSYGIPQSGSNSYSPSLSYGTPGNSHGTKPAYGPPSTSYGVPSQSYRTLAGARATNYQSYQLPFSSWYGKGASQHDIVRRVQDIIKYD